jgi:hypothetical protein
MSTALITNDSEHPRLPDAELAWLLEMTKHFIEQSSTAALREPADADSAPTGGIA